jgi:hypothetical protein
MTLKLEVDAEALLKRIDGMLGRLRHFRRIDLGAEMSEWQVDDMHRHRPFTMRARAAGRASTVIRPHSLYEMLRSEGVLLEAKQLRHVRRALKKHLRQPLPRTRKLNLRQHRHWSMRPILRAQIFAQLTSRYALLLAEKLKW